MPKKISILLILLMVGTPFGVFYALDVGMPYVLKHFEPVKQAAPPPPIAPGEDTKTHLKQSRYKLVPTDEEKKEPPPPLSEKKPQPEQNSADLSADSPPPPAEPTKPAFPPEIAAQARYLFATYNYEAVNDLLAPYAKEPEAQQILKETQQAIASLVPYTEQPVHIFFHSLIIDPKKAFKSSMAKGYNMWMTTVSEFEKMLPILLQKGYVLYPPGMMVEIGKNGDLKRRPILLPPGKKPLVLSVDDINYYGYMKNDGFATRLVPVPDGRVLTEEERDGKPVLTDTGDVVPILDNFVAQHPEFSYHGYKGILAITGYEGAFGYRLNELAQFAKLQKPKVQAKMKKHTPAEEEEMIATVRQLSNQLRRNGWDIASHSFTHNSYFRTGKITLKELKSEVERFDTRISPYVGKPLMFVSPFGMHLDSSDPRYQYLREAGYLFYMPVASTMKTELTGGMLTQNRLNLDGFTLLHKPEAAAPVFTREEIKRIVDPSRPKMNL